MPDPVTILILASKVGYSIARKRAAARSPHNEVPKASFVSSILEHGSIAAGVLMLSEVAASARDKVAESVGDGLADKLSDGFEAVRDLGSEMADKLSDGFETVCDLGNEIAENVFDIL